MTDLTFGPNLNFAVKRWPEPEAWAQVVRDAGVTQAQLAFDIGDPSFASGLDDYDRIREAVNAQGVFIHSAFSGFVVDSQNLFGHPDMAVRERWRPAVQLHAQGRSQSASKGREPKGEKDGSWTD